MLIVTGPLGDLGWKQWMRLDKSPHIYVWAGVTENRKKKKKHLKKSDKAYFLFYFRLTPTCSQAALIGLTGAEKDSLWYFVFVERDQQARTGSLRSSADRQTMKWAAMRPAAVICNALPSPQSSAPATPTALVSRDSLIRQTPADGTWIHSHVLPPHESIRAHPAIPHMQWWF